MDDWICYHYTSLASFRSIVETRRIWLTDYRFLNDQTEYRHAVSLFEAWVSQNPGRVRQGRIDGVRNGLEEHPSFVASFSRKADSAALWQVYGGGRPCVAVGIDLRLWNNKLVPNGGFHPNDPYGQRSVHEVIYTDHVDGLSVIEDLMTGEDWLGPEYLPGALAAIKRESFASEQEVRLIRPQLREPLRYREKEGGLLVPYVEDNFGNAGSHGLLDEDDDALAADQMPISRVIIGPYGEFDLIRLVVEQLTSHLDCEVAQSEVSMR